MTWSHNGVWMTSTDDRGFVKYWQANLNNVHTFQAHNDPVRSSRWGSTVSSCLCAYLYLVMYIDHELIIIIILLQRITCTCKYCVQHYGAALVRMTLYYTCKLCS